MKLIITENQFKCLIKENIAIQKAIEQYLDKLISKGSRKFKHKSRNYGNLSEEWCVGGMGVIIAIYYFDDGIFEGGTLNISKGLIKDIVSIFTIKKTFAIYVMEEWYEKTMIPKFESIVGESGLRITEVDITDEDYECTPELVKPEGITDEEMIDFIVANTLYKRNEVVKQIDSGNRNLEDFYLDVADIVERRKILGF